MSSIDNNINPTILGISTKPLTVQEIIAPEYKAMRALNQTEFEGLLYKTLAAARKTAHESEIADPQTMLSILAMYGMEEVHSLGFVRLHHSTFVYSLFANRFRHRSRPLLFVPWLSKPAPRNPIHQRLPFSRQA